MPVLAVNVNDVVPGSAKVAMVSGKAEADAAVEPIARHRSIAIIVLPPFLMFNTSLDAHIAPLV
jgi:hypothetical protein